MANPVLVDLQAAQNPSHRGRGIARYSVECTGALIDAGIPVAGIALSPYHPAVKLPIELTSRATVVTRSATALRAVVGDQPFSYFLTSAMELELTPSRTISTIALESADAVVAVLYDLIPLLFPERYLVSPRSWSTYHARLELLREVDLLLAISEHTRNDAIEHLGVSEERVAVIGAGASAQFRTPADPNEPRKVLERELGGVAALRAPFVLTVAAWEWRKNLETLVHAYGRLDPALRRGRALVVVCSGLPPGERSWHRVAAEAGLHDDEFVVVGQVSDAALAALYQACELFVFPSRYEGFGLPVLEAARCGAPALTSSTSSLPEILGLPSSTFPPDDAAAMAESVERALTDLDFRDELRDAGAAAATRHTWEAVGARLRSAWGRLDPPRAAATVPRVRVAFVGSGDIDARARADLTATARLDLFTPDGRAMFHPGADGRVYPFAALERLLDPLDYDVLVWDRDVWDDPRAARLASGHPNAVVLDDDQGRLS